MSFPKPASVSCRTRVALAAAVAFAALAATMAGASAQSPAGTLSGFLLDRGVYRTIDAPNTRVLIAPIGINERGQTVGQYVVDDSKQSGFVRDKRGGITQFDVPGARATVASKINNRGQIVGSYSENTAFVADPNARRRGFLLDKGRFTRIDVAGALITQAFGINERGQVVGEYKDAGGRFHGFLWERGRFTTIDGPDGTGASAANINDRGRIVGAYANLTPASSAQRGPMRMPMMTLMSGR
jgi:probable HAF family extracellular repeat protein